MKKKIIAILLGLSMIILAGCSADKNTDITAEKAKIDLGNIVTEIKGQPTEVSFKYSSEEEMISQMKVACENDKYTLYYSDTNLAVALKEKNSGKIFTTNPYNGGLDSNYSGNIASRLDSQVIVTYLDNKEKMVELFSSADCASLGQYSVNVYEKGVEFSLSIGKEQEVSYIPLVLSKKRYDEICKNISEDSVETLEIFYTFYSKDELSDSGVYDIYPKINKSDIYFTGAELNDREKKNLGEVFEEAKYSKKEFEEDMKSFGIENAVQISPNFKLNLRYLLTENGVDVSIPNDSVKYYDEYPLVNLSVLPYFGADSPSENSNGYLFIPDGSGAVINMNNDDEQHRSVITGKVYGENPAEMVSEDIKEKLNQFYLPVFGTVRNNQSGLFGIIKSGSANAEISAFLGRPNGNYYTAFPNFIIRDCELYSSESKVSTEWSRRTFYLYDTVPSKDDILISYYCLFDEDASYSKMAQIYKLDLFNSRKTDKTNNSVLNISTIGTALANDTFMGFDRDEEAIFTSYKQNITILEELKKEGCDNLSLYLKGWQKNGLDAELNKSLKFSKTLGGKKNFNSLLDYCSKNNISLGIENNISYATTDKAFDRFNKKTDAIKSLDYLYAKHLDSNTDIKHQEGKFIISSAAQQSLIKGLNDSVSKYNDLQLGLGEIGNVLTVSYCKNKPMNRSSGMQYSIAALKQLDKKATFNGANAYVLPYAASINNLTNINSGLDGESYSVPFVQMVLDGYVAYNSEPVNLKDNPKKEILKCIESGSVPTFVLAYDNISTLKETRYTEYYAISYNILKSEIVDYYSYLKAYNSAINGSTIKSHQVLAQDVTKTTYNNGNAIYVNQSNSDFSIDGITVKSMDYIVKEG